MALALAVTQCLPLALCSGFGSASCYGSGSIRSASTPPHESPKPDDFYAYLHKEGIAFWLCRGRLVQAAGSGAPLAACWTSRPRQIFKQLLFGVLPAGGMLGHLTADYLLPHEHYFTLPIIIPSLRLLLFLSYYREDLAYHQQLEEHIWQHIGLVAHGRFLNNSSSGCSLLLAS